MHIPPEIVHSNNYGKKCEFVRRERGEGVGTRVCSPENFIKIVQFDAF